MPGIGQDNFVVNFYVEKWFLKRIDRYAQYYTSRSAFLVKVIDICLDDEKIYGEAIMRRLYRFANQLIETSGSEEGDGEKVSVQIVLPRELMQRVDRYAAALNQSRAAALTTAAEIGLDETELFVRMWTTKPGLSIAKVINRSRKKAKQRQAEESGASPIAE